MRERERERERGEGRGGEGERALPLSDDDFSRARRFHLPRSLI